MSRNIAVVYAHPYTGSFNHAIYEEVLAGLTEAGANVSPIDLYADGFDPRYTPEELALFSEGRTLDPLVTRYQQILSSADSLVIVTPIWWADMPAILKGFFDKVLKKTWAYDQKPSGTLRGKLGHIGSAWIITTATSPRFVLRFFSGNSVQGVLSRSILKQVGIRRRRWTHFGRVTTSSSKQREAFLADVHRSAAAMGA